MTDAECERAYELLVIAIKDAGLSWLTNQVAEELRFGKTFTKEVSARPDDSEDLLIPDLMEAHRRSKVRVSATRPFTSEKLSTLLAAIEQTILATDDMEVALTKTFGRYTRKLKTNWNSIELVRTDEPDRAPVRVIPHVDKERSQQVAGLRILLLQLSKAVHG